MTAIYYLENADPVKVQRDYALASRPAVLRDTLRDVKRMGRIKSLFNERARYRQTGVDVDFPVSPGEPRIRQDQQIPQSATTPTKLCRSSAPARNHPRTPGSIDSV